MAIPNLGLRGFEEDPFETVGEGPYPLPRNAARYRQTGLTDPNLVASPDSPAWLIAEKDHRVYLDGQMDRIVVVPSEDLL